MQNSSPILAGQWWRHFRLPLSVSLSLSLSLSHRMYLTHNRKRFRVSYNTETDGSDVIIVALKLAMSLHFPLPKLRTIGNEITRSLAKSSHFSFPLHTSRLSLHHCGAEIRNEITLSVAKKFRLSQMAQAARQVIENPRQMIKSCSVPSKNCIKLIPKTIGNRKRDCAWGGSGS